MDLDVPGCQHAVVVDVRGPHTRRSDGAADPVGKALRRLGADRDPDTHPVTVTASGLATVLDLDPERDLERPPAVGRIEVRDAGEAGEVRRCSRRGRTIP